MQVLSQAGHLQPEPSPAVIRLKRQARALEGSPLNRASASRSPFLTPADLQALQDCDRVADSPDRETPSSPSTRPSIPLPEEPDVTGHLYSDPGKSRRKDMPAFKGNLRIITAERSTAQTDMPPPRRVNRPLPAQQIQSQERRSQKSSQPGLDGLYVLRTRQRAPSQVGLSLSSRQMLCSMQL